MDTPEQDLAKRDCSVCRGRGHKIQDGVKELCHSCDGLGEVCIRCYQALWRCTCPGRQHARVDQDYDEEDLDEREGFAGC